MSQRDPQLAKQSPLLPQHQSQLHQQEPQNSQHPRLPHLHRLRKLRPREIAALVGVCVLAVAIVFAGIPAYHDYAYVYRKHHEPHSRAIRTSTDAVYSEGEFKATLRNYGFDAYFNLDNVVANSFVLPGLYSTRTLHNNHEITTCASMVPQGVCVAGKYLLITAYCASHTHNSVIYVMDRKTHAFLKEVVLRGRPHVGGITYDPVAKNVWICDYDNQTDTAYMDAIPLKNIERYSLAKNHKPCKYAGSYPVFTLDRASFLDYHNNMIYVGNFVNSKDKESAVQAFALKDDGTPYTVDDYQREFFDTHPNTNMTAEEASALLEYYFNHDVDYEDDSDESGSNEDEGSSDAGASDESKSNDEDDASSSEADGKAKDSDAGERDGSVDAASGKAEADAQDDVSGSDGGSTLEDIARNGKSEDKSESDSSSSSSKAGPGSDSDTVDSKSGSGSDAGKSGSSGSDVKGSSSKDSSSSKGSGASGGSDSSSSKRSKPKKPVRVYNNVVVPVDASVISNEIQGFTIDDGMAAMSQSSGSANSSIYVFQNVGDLSDKLYTTDNASATFTLPPMLEEIATDDDGKIYLCFESAAYAYRARFNPKIDRIVVLDVAQTTGLT